MAMKPKKPGPGSSQAQINAYIKQAIAQRMEKMKTGLPTAAMLKKDPTIAASNIMRKKAAAKKTTAAKSARGGAKKTSKPAPKLY
jgi:hypothetical protein